MEAALFFSFLAIFVVTAGVTLAGMTGKLPVPDSYLKPLFRLLILEVVGAMILLFHSANFFNDPVEDFIATLPSQVRGDTPEETIENVRDLEKSEAELAREVGDQKPIVTAFKELPEAVQNPTPAMVVERVKVALAEREEFRLENEATHALLATAHEKIANFEKVEIGHALTLEECEDIKKNPLVKLNTLGGKLGPLGNETINLAYDAEAKQEEAKLILDVLVAIQQHMGGSDLSPEDVKVALAAYQGRAGLPDNGYFGAKTLERMFWDYLSRDESVKTPRPEDLPTVGSERVGQDAPAG